MISNERFYLYSWVWVDGERLPFFSKESSEEYSKKNNGSYFHCYLNITLLKTRGLL